jgi:uncharacterized membrane protein YGL010W
MPQVSAKLAPWLAEYGDDHRSPGNQRCHTVGIPLVVLSTLGLLMPLHAALPVLAAAALWYLAMDWRIALAFAPVLAAFYLLAARLSLPAHAALFVLGWAFQFYGHIVYEKRSPAFFKNILFLPIGPLFVFAKLTGWGWREPSAVGPGSA